MHFFSSTSLFLAAVPLVMGAQNVAFFRDKNWAGHKQIVPADKACHLLDASLQNHVDSIHILSDDVECEIYADDKCTNYLTEVYPPGPQEFLQLYGKDAKAVICGVGMLI